MFSPYIAMQEAAFQQSKSLVKAKDILRKNYSEEEIKSHPELLLLAGIYLELQTASYVQAMKFNMGVQHNG